MDVSSLLHIMLYFFPSLSSLPPPPTFFIAECSMDPDGTDYRGTLSVTSTGSDCIPWNLLDNHYAMPSLSHAKLKTLEENFCRNPNNQTAPWCFVGSIERPRYRLIVIFVFFS